MNWGVSEGEEKGRWGKCRRKDTNSGLGGLGPPLTILSFAVGPSDQARLLYFTYGSATVLSLLYSCMSPWCSWTLNTSFFVSNVIDVCMHAGRVYMYLVTWYLQLSRGRKEEGLLVMALHWHSEEPCFAAAQRYVPRCLPGSSSAELLQMLFAYSVCWLIPLLCRNASTCCWV